MRIFNLFFSSYDEVLCEWDTRSFRRPISESRPGGGIWRIRQHPDRPEILALACTDDGFKVQLDIIHWKKIVVDLWSL